MAGLEALLNAIGKYSWRTMLGIFVASGAFLFFSSPLGVYEWAHLLRPWLVAAFIVSGVVFLTHVGTFIYERVGQLRKADLRLVTGNPSQCRWYIGASGGTPTMLVRAAMSFAHKEENLSVCVRHAYLKGTKEAAKLLPEIVVAGLYGQEVQFQMSLLPIKAKRGQNLRGRIVFVDQFNCKHVSDRITFTPAPHVLASTEVANCFFCHERVEPSERAQEACIPAHNKCIWR